MVCFDTTFIIDYMNEQKRKVVGSATQKMRELIEKNEVPKTTIINVAELYVGPNKAANPTIEIEKIETILREIEILNLNINSAILFGTIVASLEKVGKLSSVLDTLIASIVIENNDYLLTRNMKDFEKIPGLKVEYY